MLCYVMLCYFCSHLLVPGKMLEFTGSLEGEIRCFKVVALFQATRGGGSVNLSKVSSRLRKGPRDERRISGRALRDGWNRVERTNLPMSSDSFLA
jgi:hypothetical protein